MVKNRLATKHHADAPTTQPDDVPASSHVAGGRLPKLEPRAASTDWQRALFNPSDLSAADEPEEVAPATESVASTPDAESIAAEAPPTGSIEWQRNLFETPAADRTAEDGDPPDEAGPTSETGPRLGSPRSDRPRVGQEGVRTGSTRGAAG